VNTSTVFRIGSVSKGLAAGLAGILEHEGKLKWDDPVSDYLPNFKTRQSDLTDSITIAHILSHSAGYPYQAYSTLIEDGAPLDDMLLKLQALPLSRRPGEIHAYQNVAYSLIERVIESIDPSATFEEKMHEKIFIPLHMNHASVNFLSMVDSDNVAKPHLYGPRGFIVRKISPTYYNARAAGGVNASISDMSQWLLAIMGYKPEVMPYQIRNEIFSPSIPTAVKNSYLSRLEKPRYGYYGKGWRIINYPSDTIIYHQGYVNGYKSAIAFSKTDEIGICILSNSGGHFSSIMLADFFNLYRKR
ncbi:MAG: serine hydrolase domain-containing protein, partial [Fulvivirga sp.]|nr:serine hydrolase domain-containing protein [Fulvivirga sp.]